MIHGMNTWMVSDWHCWPMQRVWGVIMPASLTPEKQDNDWSKRKRKTCNATRKRDVNCTKERVMLPKSETLCTTGLDYFLWDLLVVFNLHMGLNYMGQCVQNWYLDTLKDSFALNLTALLAATYSRRRTRLQLVHLCHSSIYAIHCIGG